MRDRLAGRHVVLEEPDLGQHEQQAGGGGGAQDRAVPRRRLGEALGAGLGRACLRGLLLLLRERAALRPVRPRVSMVPAALPRCLERRLRLVWATGQESSSSSSVRRLRSGTSTSAIAAAGASPTSSAPLTLRVAGDGGHDHAGRRARGILDVGRDLHEAAGGQLQAERPHARQPLLPALADQRGDPLRVVERGGRRELDVERDQRRARGDERGAGGRVRPRRAVVGRELVERARPPQRGSRAPARECAVQVDRQRRGRVPSRWPSSSASAHAAPRSASVRCTIGATSSAPTRGCTPACARRSIRSTATRAPCDERAVQLARLAREREDGAVVVGVGVDVEHARAAARERGADGLEDGVVAALGDVGDGQQQRLSPPRRSRRSATASRDRRPRARASSAR